MQIRDQIREKTLEYKEKTKAQSRHHTWRSTREEEERQWLTAKFQRLSQRCSVSFKVILL